MNENYSATKTENFLLSLLLWEWMCDVQVLREFSRLTHANRENRLVWEKSSKKCKQNKSKILDRRWDWVLLIKLWVKYCMKFCDFRIIWLLKCLFISGVSSLLNRIFNSNQQVDLCKFAKSAEKHLKKQSDRRSVQREDQTICWFYFFHNTNSTQTLYSQILSIEWRFI